MLTIDGSFGEGGGQVVRTSLALAALTGRPLHLVNIRAGRKKSGLLRQHLTGLRAITAICGAEVEGDQLGSREVRFVPGEIRPGAYRFTVGSAGSANLVLQTVLPPLMMAKSPSTITVEGGTHNMKSPTSDFLQHSFLPQLARFGPSARLTLHRHGFFPAGGGEITLEIEPAPLRTGFLLVDREEPVRFTATAVVANLPTKIAQRELKVIRRKLGIGPEDCSVESVRGPGPGNVVRVEAHTGGHTSVFTGFGQKGVTAEQVAKRTAGRALTWLKRGAPVCEHLADQLLIPMALAGEGAFRTGPPSLHTLTNMAVIERFLPVSFEASDDEAPTIRVSPAARPSSDPAAAGG